MRLTTVCYENRGTQFHNRARSTAPYLVSQIILRYDEGKPLGLTKIVLLVQSVECVQREFAAINQSTPSFADTLHHACQARVLTDKVNLKQRYHACSVKSCKALTTYTRSSVKYILSNACCATAKLRRLLGLLPGAEPTGFRPSASLAAPGRILAECLDETTSLSPAPSRLSEGEEKMVDAISNGGVRGRKLLITVAGRECCSHIFPICN